MIAAILKLLSAPFVNKITDLAHAYIKKQVSEAEFRAQVQKATLDTFAQVEQAWAEASTKQYESFQKTARQSPVVARAYAVVIVTQLFILLWYQWGASAFLLVTGMAWPSPGTTVDWAYAILALCLGGGAFVFRRQEIPQ